MLCRFIAALVLLAPAAVGAQSYYPTPAIQPDGDPRAPAWREPAPYAHDDQVDEGTPNDSAHRADQAYTAYLNTRPRLGWNQPASPSRADATQYARNLRQYDEAEAAYARELAAWRSGYYR
jgi:hypothetical protein